MRANKVDGNQAAIVRSLRQIPGVSVATLNKEKDGLPDILVGVHGKNYLFEIKDPAKRPSARKLTPAEFNFHSTWKGQAKVVTTLQEILDLIILHR